MTCSPPRWCCERAGPICYELLFRSTFVGESAAVSGDTKILDPGELADRLRRLRNRFGEFRGRL